MTKTVCVVLNEEDGSVMVGLQPQGEERAEGMMPGAAPAEGEESYLQPAGSIDEALQVAKDLLTIDAAQEAQNSQSFEKGFAKAGGAKPPVDLKGLMP